MEMWDFLPGTCGPSRRVVSYDRWSFKTGLTVSRQSEHKGQELIGQEFLFTILNYNNVRIIYFNLKDVIG